MAAGVDDIETFADRDGESSVSGSLGGGCQSAGGGVDFYGSGGSGNRDIIGSGCDGHGCLHRYA